MLCSSYREYWFSSYPFLYPVNIILSKVRYSKGIISNNFWATETIQLSKPSAIEIFSFFCSLHFYNLSRWRNLQTHPTFIFWPKNTIQFQTDRLYGFEMIISLVLRLTVFRFYNGCVLHELQCVISSLEWRAARKTGGKKSLQLDLDPTSFTSHGQHTHRNVGNLVGFPLMVWSSLVFHSREIKKIWMGSSTCPVIKMLSITNNSVFVLSLSRAFSLNDTAISSLRPIL